MSRPHPRRAERNAGAFLSPVGTLPVPLRTLGDDLDAGTVEPEDDREPEAPSRGAVQRAVDGLPPPWRARWLAIRAHLGWVVAVAAVVGYLVLLALRATITE
jgi:hypothetical protein